MKHAIFFWAMLFPLANTSAQKPCSAQNISGTWKFCGRIQSDCDHPPATINTDSLKNTFNQYHSSGATWSFSTDGTFKYIYPGYDNGKGRFKVVENSCDLKLSTGKRMRIVYLDDSCMIHWDYNPKTTAYLNVYRR